MQTAQVISHFNVSKGGKKWWRANSFGFLDSVLQLSGCWMDATGIMFALYHLSQVILVQVCMTLSSGLISTLVHWTLEGYWSGLSQSVDLFICVCPQTMFQCIHVDCIREVNHMTGEVKVRVFGVFPSFLLVYQPNSPLHTSSRGSQTFHINWLYSAALDTRFRD